MIHPGKLQRAYAVLDRARSVLIVLIFSFVVLAGATDILLRYGTAHGSLEWTDEILRYLNIWLVFLGAAVGVKRGIHMNVEFFLEKLFTEETRRRVRQGSLVIILVCLGLLLVAGTQKVLNYRGVQIQATTMSIAWFYLAIPVGCLLMAVDYGLILLYGKHPFNKAPDEKS
jgi:TRAP-type C4-dicarboxylate transport system permease small subunit